MRYARYPIRLAYLGIVILYRSGKIPRHYLARLVIERHRANSVCVKIAAKLLVADKCKRVGKLSHLRGMLGNILLGDRFHQSPTANIFHSCHIGEKIVLHYSSLETIARPSSARAPESGSEGHFVISSEAFCTFGNAITSRISSSPRRSVTRRSRPNARPP